MYRVSTLGQSRTCCALAQTAVQRPSSGMLDPFSPGSVRKWSSEPLRE
jgi:hypothetical protein